MTSIDACPAARPDFFATIKHLIRAGQIEGFAGRPRDRMKVLGRAWERVFNDFPDAGDPGDVIPVYREMSVRDPETLAPEILDGSRYPGNYWAFCETGAATYMQGSSEAQVSSNIRIEGSTPLSNVDPVETMRLNYGSPDECEVRILDVKAIHIEKVEWARWNGRIHDVEWMPAGA